jgi:hypothetical protein
MPFTDALLAADIPVVETATGRIPFINWFNGNQAARTPGAFYVKLDQLAEPAASPWTLTDARFPDELGYETPALNLMILAARAQPYLPLKGDDGKATGKFWLDAYQPGAHIYSEYLCLVAGIGEPVVWTSGRSANTSKAMTGKTSILQNYRTGLLAAGQRAYGQKLNLWTFWVPVTGRVDAKGAPDFVRLPQGSYVTPPTIAYPADVPPETVLEQYFVGPELLAWGYAAHQQFPNWALERRTNGAGALAPAIAEPDTDGAGEFVLPDVALVPARPAQTTRSTTAAPARPSAMRSTSRTKRTDVTSDGPEF